MAVQTIGNTTGSLPSTTAGTTGKTAQSTETNKTAATVTNATQQTQQVQQPDNAQIQVALEKLKKVAATSASDLQFSVDKDSGKTVVRVVDQTTGSLIRQIPSQDLLDIAKSVEKMQGMLLKKEI